MKSLLHILFAALMVGMPFENEFDTALADDGRLVADLDGKGPAYSWLTDDAGLSAKEADAIALRSREAFAILKADCTSGKLKLDLAPASLLGAPEPAEPAVPSQPPAPPPPPVPPRLSYL